MPTTVIFDDTAAPVSRAELQPLLLLALQQHRERVRIKRGGYAGDLATVTGRGMAGGVTVKTDSGVPLAFAATDLEAVEG